MVKSYQLHDVAANMGLLSRDNNAVSIITLGNFDIQCQKESLLSASQRPYKILELLRYFITFRNKRLLPETIIDDMWPGNESKNPRNLLRAQVFRLRKLLEEMPVNNGCQQKPCLELVFSAGYYLLVVGDKCCLDIDVFEEMIKRADSVAKEDGSRAINLYQQALALYKGQYMADTAHNEWLFPFQNRYHRLYLQALFRLLELLSSNESYREITEIYESASLIEPYDECLHLYFLQALIQLGDTKSALSHYSYITALLYKELGVKPSSAMRSIYRQLQRATENNNETDLVLLEKELTDGDDMEGALYCDIDYFRFLYHLERRKSLRTKTAGSLGLITVSSGKKPLTAGETETIMERLIPILKLSLRRGDVFARWNHNQIVIILAVEHKENLNVITKRLRHQFQEILDRNMANISIRFQPLSREDSFLK